MPFADLSGARIFYQQLGKGPSLVFLHGLAANHAFWFTRTAFALRQRYRLTLYDLRGHGRSSMPSSGYTSADQTQDLVELMDHLKIRDTMLVGHSFGGNIALHLTTLYPERVRALVVADSRIYALQEVQRLIERLGQILMQQGLINEQRLNEALQEQTQRRVKIGQLFIAKGVVSEEQVALALRRQQQLSNSIEEQLLQGADIDTDQEQHIGLRLLEEWMAQRKSDVPELPGSSYVPFGRESSVSRSAESWLRLVSSTTAKDDFRAPAGLSADCIAEVRSPMLAVYGERSRCLPSGLALKGFGADLHIVPGAGHFHPVTRQRQFLRTLAAFLRNVARAEGVAAGNSRGRGRATTRSPLETVH